MTTFDLAKLGQEIRRRRVARGLTLAQLAEACLITPSYLGAIETGRRDVDITTLLAIAGVLRCSASDLVSWLDTNVSPTARSMGQMFDRASPQAQDAALRMLRDFVANRSAEKNNTKNRLDHEESKGPPRRRDGGMAS